MRTLRVTVAFNATNRLKFATLLSAASSPLNAAEMSSVICGQAMMRLSDIFIASIGRNLPWPVSHWAAECSHQYRLNAPPGLRFNATLYSTGVSPSEKLNEA